MDSGTEDNSQERAAQRRAPEGKPVPATKSESWMRLLIQTLPVAIFHADVEGNITYVNDYWSDLTGRPVTTAMGGGWKEAVHPDDVPLIVAEWQRCVSLGIECCLQFRYVRPDGEIVWALGRTVEERDADGSLIGYVSSVTDVTELREELSISKRSPAAPRRPAPRKAAAQGVTIRKNGASTGRQRLSGGQAEADQDAARPGVSLTPREVEVFKLLAQGKSNKQVGRILEISVKTAETHRARIRRKLCVDSAAALVRYAIRNGFIVP
jgi:PAS domain S-box-containing protein